MHKLPVVTCVGLLLVAFPGFAAQPVSATAPLDSVLRCQTITSEQERLACYDRNVALLGKAHESKSVLVLDRREVVEQKKRRFGLGALSAEVAGGADAERDTAVTTVTTTLTRAVPARGAAGRWNLVLANGMSWQTLEDIARAPVPGSTVLLEHASLGGYRATIATQKRKVPVKRVR